MANNKRIGELLVDLEFITKEQLNAALLHQKKNAPQKKVGEILVELGFLNELDLLRCLAGLFRIRYLSSDKLSKMTIPQWILNLIPLEFAEKYNVLPFFCYDKSKILSVVISEPQDRQLPKMIKNISGYNEVEKYLALGSTINAAIAMHYKNDYTAFDRLKELTKGGLAQAIASFAPRNEPAIDSEYSDSTELNVLALKLKRNGILPYLTDDTDKAANILKNIPINLIISEINTQPIDGFSFCNFIKTHPKYKNISFIFLSKENDSNQITKGFEAGADDFMAKPCNPDILIAKINNFIKLETKKTEEEAEWITRKKGITGNLAEVQITELIQMLSRGRKTGVLKLFKDEEDGKIFFNNGQIINAQYLSTEGVEAFNNLVRWEHGLFILDPDAELSEQKIYENTEMLLIEACRLWDEEKND
jgi:DNA-binding response OmpR family regulator